MAKNPQSTDEQPRDKAGASVVVWLLLGLVVLFGGLYVAAHYVAGDKVPRNTTVSGVRIGGHPQAEAAQRLQAGLADQVNRDIAATIEGQPVAIDPAEAGLGVDYEASVAEAGGEESWDPVRLWNYFTGGDAFEAEVTVDEAAFQAYLAGLDEQHGATARDGAITFDGAQVVTRKARTGAALDPADDPRRAATAFLEDEPADVALEMADVVPAIDAGDVEEALDGFASPAVAAPVTLSFEGSNIKVFPADYTAALSLVPTDGELVPTLDAAKLTEVVGSKVTQRRPGRRDRRAGQRHAAGRPGQAGRHLRRSSSSRPASSTRSRSRRASARWRWPPRSRSPTSPPRTPAPCRSSERVSTFTTYFPYAEYRNVNIGRAAEIIDGTLLKPGETFSLNDTVGERTEANGFTKGYIISDGILIQDLGGGVSQMATTTFNAMFFAGLEDVEHKPHSFYIDRYPVGREATVAWGAVDLRFTNDTPYGVLIHTNVTPSTPSSSGVVTVTMYSTKYWDITTTTGERYNLTQPKTRRIDDLTCHPNEGFGGFDIDVMRYFRRSAATPRPATTRSSARPTRPATRSSAPTPTPSTSSSPSGAARRVPRTDLGREPVQVAREERDLADVGRADQPRHPALQPDREAAVRRHAVPERLEVGVVRRRVLAARPDGPLVVRRAGAAAGRPSPARARGRAGRSCWTSRVRVAPGCRDACRTAASPSGSPRRRRSRCRARPAPTRRAPARARARGRARRPALPPGRARRRSG